MQFTIPQQSGHPESIEGGDGCGWFFCDRPASYRRPGSVRLEILLFQFFPNFKEYCALTGVMYINRFRMIMRRGLLKSILAVLAVPAIMSCGNKPADEKLVFDRDHDRRITITADSVYTVSAFINDPDDPVNLLGIDLTMGEEIPTGKELIISATSSNQKVVPDANLILSGTGTKRNLRIKPIAAGYSTIRVMVTAGSFQHAYSLNYAASATASVDGKRWHAGIADASAAVMIDKDFMLVANDETNFLYLYHRGRSGPVLKALDFNPNNALALTDSFAGVWKEVDVEGGARSINNETLVYWIGSMSNNSSFLDRPNRNKLFAVTITGKGTGAGLKNAGHYGRLRQDLIAWGDQHGYDLSGCAAMGRDCKKPDGFNIEGIVFGPDKKTLYIAFRAPLVPATSRTKALIAPINDFEQWFNSGVPAAPPKIGPPIELDLGGRGFRDIIRLDNGSYVIIAGSCGAAMMPAVFTWSGQLADAPVMANAFSLEGLNVEGVLPVYENGQLSLNKLQVLTDNGNDIFYGDTILAKNLPVGSLKRFSSVVTEAVNRATSANTLKIYPLTSGK
jgi:hypothetical protein